MSQPLQQRVNANFDQPVLLSRLTRHKALTLNAAGNMIYAQRIRLQHINGWRDKIRGKWNGVLHANYTAHRSRVIHQKRVSSGEDRVRVEIIAQCESTDATVEERRSFKRHCWVNTYSLPIKTA